MNAYAVHIIENLPSSERIVVNIDGTDISDTDNISVPDSFHIKIQQYRESAVPGSVKKNGFRLLSILPFGGRVRYGAEMTSADWAVWEADCEISSDAALSITLEEQNGVILFAVKPENIYVSTISSYRTINPQARTRYWGLMLPLLIPVTVGLSIFLIIVLKECFNAGTSSDTRILIGVSFVPMLLYGLFHLWSSCIQDISAPKQDKNADAVFIRKIERMTVILNCVTVLFFLTAIAEFVLPIVWNYQMILFMDLFPCTAILIMAGWSTLPIIDRLEYASNAVREAGSKLKKANKRLLIAFATVVIMTFITLRVLGLLH